MVKSINVEPIMLCGKLRDLYRLWMLSLDSGHLSKLWFRRLTKRTRKLADFSYYVYVCRRGSFTNFSHGGPLDVCSYPFFTPSLLLLFSSSPFVRLNAVIGSWWLARMGRSNGSSEKCRVQIKNSTPPMIPMVKTSIRMAEWPMTWSNRWSRSTSRVKSKDEEQYWRVSLQTTPSVDKSGAWRSRSTRSIVRGERPV